MATAYLEGIASRQVGKNYSATTVAGTYSRRILNSKGELHINLETAVCSISVDVMKSAWKQRGRHSTTK